MSQAREKLAEHTGLKYDDYVACYLWKAHDPKILVSLQ